MIFLMPEKHRAEERENPLAYPQQEGLGQAAVCQGSHQQQAALERVAGPGTGTCGMQVSQAALCHHVTPLWSSKFFFSSSFIHILSNLHCAPSTIPFI